MYRLVLLLAFVAGISAQGNLNSYSAIRNALQEGSELQMNAVSSLCDVTGADGDGNRTVIVSMPMRQWQLVRTDTEEFVRADDWYVSAIDPAMIRTVFRHLLVFPDNSVDVTLTSSDGEEPVNLVCTLGDGANVHRVIPGNDLEEIDSYQEVKSLLLAGDHIEAVGNLRQCRNSDEVFPNGAEYIVGYQINRFSVQNDGTADEAIVIDDVAVFTASAGDLEIGTERLILLPDETVRVIATVYSGDFEVIANIELDCDYGNAIEFDIHEREEPSTYITYDEVKEATIDGHDMELIVFLELCSVVEGGEGIDLTGTIGSVRFDQYEFNAAGGIGGDVEFIEFPSRELTVDGRLEVDIVRVTPDGIVQIEAFEIAAGSETVLLVLSCPLEEAALFHSVRRTRAPVQTFAEIIAEIEDRGQTFEVEIDFDGCDVGNVTTGRTVGGIMWQTYVDNSETDGYFFGNMFSLEQATVDGAATPVWDATGVLLRPDGSVTVVNALYDYFTGANLIEGGHANIECALATAAGGSVYFHRYP